MLSVVGLRTAAVSISLLLLGMGCQGPTGPPFAPAAAPAGDRGLVYVYRAGDLSPHGRARVRVGALQGSLGPGESLWIDLPAGRHQLRFLWTQLIAVSAGWTSFELDVQPGVTHAVRVQTTAREVEAAGSVREARAQNRTLSVRAQRVPLEQALRELADTRQSPDPPSIR
ncbi:MAG: hypothetical protein MJE66_24625 [Proteobacteria bacterium]|nr:hypothetical protein [Pseudomonadota bacterium]